MNIDTNANTNSNIVNSVASSLSKLNLNASQKVKNIAPKEENYTSVESNNDSEFDAKKEDISLMDTSKTKNPVDVEDIRKYAQLVGEDLSIEDINYGLMYGRSVIADYSV